MSDEFSAELARLMYEDEIRWLRDMHKRGHSTTLVPEHTHECRCGTWVCMDELCEPDESRRGELRDCPTCQEEVE